MFEVLDPLIKAFAKDATPLDIVMFIIILFMCFVSYFRERERRELVRKIISLGIESAKTGMSMAQAVDTGNREAREERAAIEALLKVGHDVYQKLQEMNGRRERGKS